MVDLWRAVDAEGEVLDVLVQSKRNRHTALKLMRKLLKKYATGATPSGRRIGSAVGPARSGRTPKASSAPCSPAGRIPNRGSSREGKRVLSIYLSPEARKQLRLLSLNLETSAQTLGEEAINLLFDTGSIALPDAGAEACLRVHMPA